MRKAKIAITIDAPVLERIDRLIEARIYANRSQAIEAAVEQALERLERRRLARECGKLDPAFEKSIAEEGIVAELDDWPEY